MSSSVAGTDSTKSKATKSSVTIIIIMKNNNNNIPAKDSPESPREFSLFASRYSLLQERLNVVAYLSEDLIADILSNLPVKILLRYKCVSKTWCSLIQSPHFVKMHLRKSVECKTSSGIIVRACGYYLADSDLLNDTAAVEIDDPFKTRFFGSAIMGSSNGLFCMLTAKRDILLWNPSTRKCQKLPDAPIDLPRFCCIHGGFGYDLLNDDYRVVVIARPKTKGSEASDSKVLVYSLKTNSWRHMKDLSCFLQFQELWGAFVSNNLHWVTMDTHDSIRYLGIFAFDFEDEKYYLLSLPDLEVQTFNMNVGILGGSLTILANKPNDRMNVWVMNKYGKRNSWSKLFSVKQLQVIGGFDTLRPLIYSKSGKGVLLEVNNKKVMWFDLETNEIKNVSIGGIPGIFRLEVYHQSLVPLNNDFESNEKQQKQPHVNQKKKQTKRQKKNDARGFHSMGFKLLL